MTTASPAPTGTKPQVSSRPSLANVKRSSSYLQDHQQYRPPANKPEGHFGIDTVVEGLQTTALSPSRPAHSASTSPVPAAFNGIPSPENPPKIVDSGLVHDLTHPNCAGGSKAPRLIATLFYKASAPRVSNAIPSPARVQTPPGAAVPDAAADSIPANMAPTTALEDFPMEPPAAEPEPLDHLYGSYISPLCIASFLHLMSTFPLPPGSDTLSSAHRCLDNVDQPLVVELTLDPAPAPSYLPLADLRRHELLYRFEREWNVDVVLQPDTLWRRHPRLVVFDMDSTLITQEVIDLMAATIRDPPELASRIADITHRAMMGELEFDAAFRERVQLLKGLPASIFEQLRPVLDVTPGVRETIRALKRLGVKTAVCSGGFRPLTEWLAGELGIDHAHANEVEIVDGVLTGNVNGLIVGKERKRDLLVEIAKKEGIALEQTVAVGDGANDLLMMEAAGLGVAWNAKPMVQMEADARLNGGSMTELLYLFGFRKEEVEMLTAA